MFPLHHLNLIQIELNGEDTQGFPFPKTNLKNQVLFATFPEIKIKLKKKNKKPLVWRFVTICLYGPGDVPSLKGHLAQSLPCRRCSVNIY